MRQTPFFFHYNKPASKAAGRNKLTIHIKGKCYLVDGIKCHVPVQSVDRKTQPRCILKGYCLPDRFIICKNSAENKVLALIG